MKRIDNYFTLTEATELGTHCALHHSYSPQEQKYLFRLDVFDQKEIKLAISQKAHHGEMDFSAFERIDNMCAWKFLTRHWSLASRITATWRRR